MNEKFNQWLVSDEVLEFNCNDFIKDDGSVIQHEVASLQPPMSDKEFEELKDDLQFNGQINPIYVIERFNPRANKKYYQIIDGRHRVLALNELEIGIVFGKVFKAQTPNKILSQFVESIHKRRNLTATQKAMKVLLYYIRAKEDGEKVSLDDLSSKHKISKQTLSRANTIYKTLGINAVMALFNGKLFAYGGKQYKNINQLYNAIKEDEKIMKKDNDTEKLANFIIKLNNIKIGSKPKKKVIEKVKEIEGELDFEEKRLLTFMIANKNNINGLEKIVKDIR
jgi:hypothetical protein